MTKTCLLVLTGLLAILTADAQISPFRSPVLLPGPHGMSIDSLKKNAAAAKAAGFRQPYHRVQGESKTAAGKPGAEILGANCNVKASFTPGNDTTLYTGQAITYSNTSLNADSYEWFTDVYFRSTTTDLQNYVPSVGVTQIMLVAHSGGCTDTAVSYIVRNGTPPVSPSRMNTTYGFPNMEESEQCITKAATDGYLLAGLSGMYSDPNWYNAPYFVRVSETGCILWSKLFPVQLRVHILGLVTTYDGGFIADVASGDNPDSAFIVKMDADGNVLWMKTYHGDNSIQFVTAIRELADHSLMLVSGSWTGQYYLLTHITGQGAFLWQKKYVVRENDYARFTDLVEKDGDLFVSGSYFEEIDASKNLWNSFPTLTKVETATGNLIWSKGYSSPEKGLQSSGIHFYKNGLLLNGFADSLLYSYSNERNNYQTLIETDFDGNVRDSKLINGNSVLDVQIGNSVIVRPDNSLDIFYSGVMYMELQPGYSDQSHYLHLDQNKQPVWGQNYYDYTVEELAQAVAAPGNGMAMLGRRFSSLSNPVFGLGTNLILVKTDADGASAAEFCDQHNWAYSIQDMPVTPYSPGEAVVTSHTLQVIDRTVTDTRANSELRYHCPDYVPLCSFMKLSGKSTVCNLKDTLEFVAHKDPTCADPVTWTYDQAAIKTTYSDGARTRLLFSKPGIYKIRAEKPFPCSDMVDSVMVTVAPALVDFSLGQDTTLCTGDSLDLQPQGHYDQYKWQDNSTAKSFRVKTAGVYQLTVTDSCGNQKTDDIRVGFRASVPVDLGLPRIKCAADSVTVVPPTGFKDYAWTPAAGGLFSPDGKAVLFPRQHSVYNLKVHDINGCTGTASINVDIYPNSVISLGPDTAICEGQQIVFSVPGNFNSYAWNNGWTGPELTTGSAGVYSVHTTDENHCQASDTVRLTINPLPAVAVTGNNSLCAGQPELLDAGPGFAAYYWQDGSTNRQFQVTDTGMYQVMVSDRNKCTASGDFHVAAYAPVPKDFLPADTTVCEFYGGSLIPAVPFAAYNWSTGETSPTIFIKAAGEYWLEVTSAEGCRGRDSTIVKTTNCEALLRFPNAFTPNQDGKNDVFRLRYPGIVAAYQLKIFNRWGELLFESRDPYAGWDGTYSGVGQPVGNYVWTVSYKDRNGKPKNLSGSVVLIR